MRNYKRLNSPKFRAMIYESGDSALIRNYEENKLRAEALKNTIEATTGAWSAAKDFYKETTDVTSTVIGDWIDEFRSWWGYDPAGGLGAIQIPMAVWVVGIIAAAVAANRAMSKLFVQAEAYRLQRDDPTMSRERALQVASNALAPSFFRALNTPLIIAGVLAVFLLMQRRR